MKVKIFALGLIFLILISCEKGIENPYSPEVYVTYKVRLQIGAISTLGPAYLWKIYVGADDILIGTLTILNGNVSSGNREFYVEFQMLKTSSEETFPVKWKLTSCSSGETWASGATYQYWMTVFPLSSGITVDPIIQQRVGPFNGWLIDDIKQLTFKIKKL